MVRRPCTAPGQSGDETRPTVVHVNWNVSLTMWHCFEMAGIAGRKRPRLSSDGFTTRGQHKIGYNASWKTDFPWHTPVYNSSESTVFGLLCCVCKRHGTKPRNQETTSRYGQLERALNLGPTHYSTTRTPSCTSKHNSWKQQG